MADDREGPNYSFGNQLQTNNQAVDAILTPVSTMPTRAVVHTALMALSEWAITADLPVASTGFRELDDFLEHRAPALGGVSWGWEGVGGGGVRILTSSSDFQVNKIEAAYRKLVEEGTRLNRMHETISALVPAM